jgi:hypothetical protein
MARNQRRRADHFSFVCLPDLLKEKCARKKSTFCQLARKINLASGAADCVIEIEIETVAILLYRCRQL